MGDVKKAQKFSLLKRNRRMRLVELNRRGYVQGHELTSLNESSPCKSERPKNVDVNKVKEKATRSNCAQQWHVERRSGSAQKWQTIETAPANKVHFFVLFC